ncbi:hypothetical protein MMMDOFMJ_3894 [Methylobacterium gnaphalii]|nr:hypothetical protein MMMDOFMJ_3894 [Methylobacterium gnaphalii]
MDLLGGILLLQASADKTRPQHRRCSSGERGRDGEGEESENQVQGCVPSTLVDRGDRLAGKP